MVVMAFLGQSCHSKGVTCLPNSSELHQAIVAALPVGGGQNAIDPAIDGLRIIQLQRAHLIAGGGIDGEFCAIGGFAQLTTVTADAMTSRVIHRWPDKVGDKFESCAISNKFGLTAFSGKASGAGTMQGYRWAPA